MPNGEPTRRNAVYWGLTEEEFDQLFKGTQYEYELETRLNEYLQAGVIDDEQFDEIAAYIYYRWDVQADVQRIAEQEARISLPAGSSAFDVYRRVVASGQKLNQASWNRLKEGMAMERQEARQLAAIRTASAEGKKPPAFKPIEVPPAYLGERWTPAAQAYEKERAEAWLGKEQAQLQAKESERRRRAEEEGEAISTGRIAIPAAAKFAEEHPGVSSAKASVYGLGLVTGGGGFVDQNTLAQLQAKPPEVRAALTQIGRELLAKIERQQAEGAAFEAAKAKLKLPYVPPLYEELGVTGTPTWRDWFENKYGSAARQFVAKAPEERQAETWAEFLKSKKAAAREEFWGLGTYGRGERPAAFQPAVRTETTSRTVGFQYVKWFNCRGKRIP